MNSSEDSRRFIQLPVRDSRVESRVGENLHQEIVVSAPGGLLPRGRLAFPAAYPFQPSSH